MLDLQSVYFGQRNKDFDYKDFDLIKKVGRLARKHQRQATNDCNGEGFVNGQHYYSGQIDDYARRQYGQGVKSSYMDDTEETIFCKEMDKLSDKIDILVKSNSKFNIEYQGDPRGYTVKLSYEGELIEW